MNINKCEFYKKKMKFLEIIMISWFMTVYDSILWHKTLNSISQHITECAYWSELIMIRGCAYDEKATTAINGD